MNADAQKHAEQFLAISDGFRLGDLVTESSHPVTAELSLVADLCIQDALKLLFRVDDDVVAAYRSWIESGAPERISGVVVDALRSKGRVFFTGCGATGRLSIQLDAIWRGFWESRDDASVWGDRTRSVMAGGDYALIKSVEGFEDFTQFGAKQIDDMGVGSRDVVFAITEGGETSFVIGTAWQGLDNGAKVYFVYNNPDDILRSHVTRSREIIGNPRIEKINLTTGPMAIMGSTRMQATSIQLCVMLTILEMVVRTLSGEGDSSAVPQQFLASLETVHDTLLSPDIRDQLAKLVSLEETAYRDGRKSGYFADLLGIDVLTDTTERSPTFCIPAFRKWDDANASQSWAYLFLPHADTESAWEQLLKRPVRCLAWDEEQIRTLVPEEMADRQCEIMKQIGRSEILRFRIGIDALAHRPWNEGDLAVCVVGEPEMESLTSADGFFKAQMGNAVEAGASAAVILLGRDEAIAQAKEFIEGSGVPCKTVFIPLPDEAFLLDGILHIAVKMLLNAHSTCVMTRLGRVTGNCMTSVVPSNLKLIDRSIRYIRTLTGLTYEDACRELFESIEYIKPRMHAGIAYPPVVKLTVTRLWNGFSSDQAELAIS